jgi:hypothetical protein
VFGWMVRGTVVILKIYESSGSESLAECGGNSGAVCDCVGCCGVLCSPPIYSAGGRGGFLF